MTTLHEPSVEHGIQERHASGASRRGLARRLHAVRGLSVNALAKALCTPTPRINDIVRERRGITADTALRLARYFGEMRSCGSTCNLSTTCASPRSPQRKIEREIEPMTDMEREQHVAHS
jgi:plasmid maintenance system antidote protein VapI